MDDFIQQPQQELLEPEHGEHLQASSLPGKGNDFHTKVWYSQSRSGGLGKVGPAEIQRQIQVQRPPGEVFPPATVEGMLALGSRSTEASAAVGLRSRAYVRTTAREEAWPSARTWPSQPAKGGRRGHLPPRARRFCHEPQRAPYEKKEPIRRFSVYCLARSTSLLWTLIDGSILFFLGFLAALSVLRVLSISTRHLINTFAAYDFTNITDSIKICVGLIWVGI